MADITYTAPPTISRFMESTAFFRLLAGPIGGGKTTGVLFEMLRRSIEQAPGPDGLRRTRWAIVRTTLEQLKTTILLDIMSWFRHIATYKVSEKLIVISFNDVYSEWYMIPLDDEEDQKRLLSMQLTGAFMSECIEMETSLTSALSGRCGRFPSGAVAPTWRGILADTNMPVEGSEWHKFMELETPPDWEIFKQPGGLEPNAENLAYLDQTAETLKLDPSDPVRQAQGRKYYERNARNPNPAWVTRYVHAQYGEDPSGSAVFRATFRRNWHVSEKPLEAVHGMPLLIGQDFGRAPCSLICQLNPIGQLMVLKEVVAEDISLEPHVVTSLKPALFHERFMGRYFAAVGDPSGRAKGNNYEETSFELLDRLGIPSFPAPTNGIEKRLAAVDELLLGVRMGPKGAVPALIIDGVNCPKLVLGLNGLYRYGNTKAGQQKPAPDKVRPYADLADCLQYVCLVVNSGMTLLITRRIRMRHETKQERRIPAGGWT